MQNPPCFHLGKNRCVSTVVVFLKYGSCCTRESAGTGRPQPELPPGMTTRAMSYRYACVSVYVCVRARVFVYIIYIYNVFIYIYTSDDAEVSASIHIYNICIGSRFLKILVQRRLPLRFETVAP